MSNNKKKAQGGMLVSLAVFLLITALEAAGLNWVWNHVVTVAFSAKPMLFGHMFMMVLAVRVFFRDIMRLGDIWTVLEEIKEMQYLTALLAAQKAAKEEKSTPPDNDNK